LRQSGGSKEKIIEKECPKDVDGRGEFERHLKCGIYKELHARGLLSDAELAELISRAGRGKRQDGRIVS